MTTGRSAFVLGCQRSGTTLLRFLLAAHGDVISIDEEVAYPTLAGRRARTEELDRAPNALRVFKVPRLSEQLLEAEIRDETYGRFPQFYRGEVGVFVVRDPRDVVASMCTLRAGRDTSWVAAYGKSMIEHRETHREGFAARHEAALAELRDRQWPPHLVAALYWRVKNEALPAYVAAGLPLLPIRYEDLVRNAESAVRAICERFGLSFDARMLRHQELEHDQLQPSGLAIGNSDPKRGIDSQSVGRYRQLLDSESLREVENWTHDLFEQLQQHLARV